MNTYKHTHAKKKRQLKLFVITDIDIIISKQVSRKCMTNQLSPIIKRTTLCGYGSLPFLSLSLPLYHSFFCLDITSGRTVIITKKKPFLLLIEKDACLSFFQNHLSLLTNTKWEREREKKQYKIKPWILSTIAIINQSSDLFVVSTCIDLLIFKLTYSHI